MLGSRLTVLEAINEVAGRMSLRSVAATTDNSWSRNMVRLLNDLVAEMADFGKWDELSASASFAMVCGQSVYQVATTAANSANFQQIASIEEVSISGRVAPLEPISDKTEFRMLVRTGSIGTPSRYIPIELDGEHNSKIGLFPRPGTTMDGQTAHVHYQVLPPRYEAGTDDAVLIQLPGRVVVQGLLAAAMLDEAGGAETQQWKTQQGKYMEARKAALPRRTSRTGGNVRFQPGLGSRW